MVAPQLQPFLPPGDGGEDSGGYQVRPKGGWAEANPCGRAPASQDAGHWPPRDEIHYWCIMSTPD